MISCSDKVIKVYHNFDKNYIKIYKGIDINKYDFLHFFNDHKELKQEINTSQSDFNLYEKISTCLKDQFEYNHIYNYGLDLIEDSVNKTFYIIDINIDCHMWLRFAD